MGDLKRLVLPVIVALILHGFLASFQLPKQQTVKPSLKGNSIKVEISTFSPESAAPEKKKEIKQKAKIEEIVSEPDLERKKPEQTKVTAKPIVILKQQSKLKIEPEQKEEVVEDKIRNTDLQNKQSEPQLTKDVEKLLEVATKRVSAIQATAIESAVDTEDGSKEDLLTEQNALAPLQQKAIPIYRQNKQPPYPVMARRRSYEGEILLNVLVDPEGMVSEITIKRSSGHLSLDRAAIKAVKKWLFIPAMEGSRPVSMWVDIPIDFQLK